MMERTRLVVVNGPIASGKTTTTQALATWARARSLKAAAIEMDDVMEIARGTDWTRPWTATDWRLEVTEALASHPDVRFVTLETSLEETLRRCAADDGRVLTKDAAFVSRIYAGLNWKGLPADELFLSTEKLSTEEVVDAIAKDVGLR